jgi:hypothetical protein
MARMPNPRRRTVRAPILDVAYEASGPEAGTLLPHEAPWAGVAAVQALLGSGPR